MCETKIDEGPSHQDVVDYWSQREDECGLAVDWSEAHERCWRCGCASKLQRCHIIPGSRNGELTANNLVLLCDLCHKEAPNTTDARMMWIWLRSTCVPFYETFLVARGLEEFARMFGRLPFTNLSPAALQSSEFTQTLDEEINSTIGHNGQGRRNPATLACIYARTEERMSREKLSGIEIQNSSMLITFLALNPAMNRLLIDLPRT